MTTPTRTTATTAARRRFSAQLEAWFDDAARDLPWRTRRSGYTGLVSEAMLQQTQVARVVERFETFIARFPTVEALAAASEQEVLALWQGLGYYRRARSLHAAARRIVEEHDGVVPSDVETLLRLPGVGRYTAGAIASIIFGHHEPAVDGNVQRVLARRHARRGAADEADHVAWCWQEAETLVRATDRPGVLNEALMELGATICTPARPRCDACPVRDGCRAAARGLTAEIPAPKKAVARRAVHHHVVVVRRGVRVLFEQRPDDGLWARMWQPPCVEAGRRLSANAVLTALEVSVEAVTPHGSFEHNTTHRAITFHVYEGRTRARRGVWREPDDVADLPMSNAHKRALQMVLAGGTASAKTPRTGHRANT